MYLQATLSNDSSITTGPLILTTRRSQYQAALGPLRAEPHGVRTFVPLYVRLENASTPITVHFVVSPTSDLKKIQIDFFNDVSHCEKYSIP